MVALTASRFRPRAETVVAVAVLALVALVFLHVSPSNPPGFYKDESAIAYNAYTLETTGRDEYGARLPLFIASFGDWKSPLYVYLLAGIFWVTGPSAEVARTFSAVLGLGAVLVLSWLAWSISRRRLVAAAVAALAGLSPWLFENSRLVFEVAILPLLIALLLLVAYRASAGRWRWTHSLAIGVLLAALAYGYQAGRVLAPAYAVGLACFWFRAGWRRLALAWGVFLVAAAPIVGWAAAHPGALTVRYHATTYITPGMSKPEIVWQFLVHYARNLNLWAWLVRGDVNPVHHVHGDGMLFWVEVILALAGLVLVVRDRRSDPWWRFVAYAAVVSPVAASLTVDRNSLRMIALPVLLPVLAIPALERIATLPSRGIAVATAAGLTAIFAFEAIHWQVVWDRHGPDRVGIFDGVAHRIAKEAIARGGTVYTSRAHGLYIDVLFDNVAAGRSPGSVVVLRDADRPPPGAVYAGAPGDCRQCTVVDRLATYAVMRYKPAPPGVLRTSFQLTSPLLPVGSPLQFLVEVDNKGRKPADHVVLTIRLPKAMKLSGPPWYQRGTGCKGRETIVCNIGFFPKKSFVLFRYGVTVLAGGPLTMTASLGSDRLDVNPAGTASAFTVNLLPPAYAHASRPPG
jgi:hypothetical protein